MKARVLCFCCLLPLLASALGQTVAPTAHSGMPAQKVRIAEGYGRLPLAFEANQGQSDPQVKFLTRGAGYSLFLTSTEAVLTLRKGSQQMPDSHSAKSLPPLEQSAVLHMKLAGANAKTEVSGQEELPGNSNYFVGNDPKKWQPNVRQYAKVRYENVYRGVDLVYYGNQRELEYDFVLQPGTDPSVIRLGIEGATKLRLEQGDLVLSSPAGNVHLRRPQIYQQVNGVRREIRGGYAINRNEVGFRIASYDRRRELIIDPVLSYSTLLGGNGFDYGNGIAVDTAGNAYVTGSTSSNAFPTANAIYPTKPGGEDVFITKFNADGSALVYSTYLGGSGSDYGNGITVDTAGNAYVTGRSESPDFPTANAIQSTNHGGFDAFVTKISAEGTVLAYSTYLGGDDWDLGFGIAVDTAGNAYVTGQTWSHDFPTIQALQSVSGGGGNDVFVSKINAAGTALVYSTYLGGGDQDSGNAIALDSARNIFVTGYTESTDFPIANAIQPTHHRNTFTVFVSKINAAGTALMYSTYLGGSLDDRGSGIAVDSAGNAYVTGLSKSTDFPTANAIQPTLRGRWDAFVTKFNADGSRLLYSTFLGGIHDDSGSGIAVDSAGNAYVTGLSRSKDFPSANAIQINNHGGGDAFVTKINSDGSSLLYSTFLGGNGWDYGSAIAADAAGSAYVTGHTGLSNFPTTPLAFQRRGYHIVFVAKIAQQTFVSVSPLKLSFNKQVIGTTSAPKQLSLINQGSSTLTINKIYVEDANAADFAETNTCSVSLAAGETCTIWINFTPTASGKRQAVLGISDSDPASPQAVALTGSGTVVSLSPKALSFPKQPVNTTSAPKTVILTNVGSAALNFTGISVTGTNAGDFSQTNTCGTSIAGGANCTITVTFTPTATGTRKAAVSIIDDGGGSPQKVTLTGSGS